MVNVQSRSASLLLLRGCWDGASGFSPGVDCLMAASGLRVVLLQNDEGSTFSILAKIAPTFLDLGRSSRKSKRAPRGKGRKHHSGYGAVARCGGFGLGWLTMALVERLGSCFFSVGDGVG